MESGRHKLLIASVMAEAMRDALHGISRTIAMVSLIQISHLPLSSAGMEMMVGLAWVEGMLNGNGRVEGGGGCQHTLVNI